MGGLENIYSKNYKIKMAKKLNGHTQPSLNCHNFVRWLKQNKTHNKRARRTAAAGYDLSALVLPELQVITSF